MKICGARSKRTGLPCRHSGTGAGGRCFLHGGNNWNNGSKKGQPTWQAFAKWQKNLAIRHAMGLKQRGGKPRGRKRSETLVAKAKQQLEIVLEAARPEGRPDMTTREIAQLPPTPLPADASHARILGMAALEGAKRLYEIVCMPLDWGDLKQVRLIGDMALGTSRLVVKAAQQEQHDHTLQKLLEEIQRDRGQAK
jgi:hypothetical protein